MPSDNIAPQSSIAITTPSTIAGVVDGPIDTSLGSSSGKLYKQVFAVFEFRPIGMEM